MIDYQSGYVESEGSIDWLVMTQLMSCDGQRMEMDYPTQELNLKTAFGKKKM